MCLIFILGPTFGELRSVRYKLTSKNVRRENSYFLSETFGFPFWRFPFSVPRRGIHPLADAELRINCGRP